MAKRVLLAGISHETHTFVPGVTGLDDFVITPGAGMWADEGGTSNIAGVLEVARQRAWEVIPVLHMRASPGAVVTDEVFEHFWGAFAGAAGREAAEGIDGVYLVLHGAMAGTKEQDPEGRILAGARSILGAVPLVASLDLHAVLTDRMLAAADVLVPFHTYPHTDQFQTGARAAKELLGLLREGRDARGVGRPQGQKQPDLAQQVEAGRAQQRPGVGPQRGRVVGPEKRQRRRGRQTHQRVAENEQPHHAPMSADDEQPRKQVRRRLAQRSAETEQNS